MTLNFSTRGHTLRTAQVSALIFILAGGISLAADYAPGLGEIMSVVQQHHAKLFYAGHAANWDLARYELEELQEDLDDASKARHEFKTLKTPLKDLIPAMTKPQLEKISAAIEKKSKVEFAKSFQALTVSCNSCHHVAEHPFIVIQVPTQPAFPNQRFTK